MKTLTWTTQALTAGGELRIRQIFPGKSIFRATMAWPNEQDVTGEISLSGARALENLEQALMEDAAEEMRRSGAV